MNIRQGLVLVLMLMPPVVQAATVHSLMALARQQVGQTAPREARLEGEQAAHFLKLTQGRGPVDVQTSLIRPINPDCQPNPHPCAGACRPASGRSGRGFLDGLPDQPVS